LQEKAAANRADHTSFKPYKSEHYIFSEELMVIFYQQDGVSKHETYYPALGYLSRGFMIDRAGRFQIKDRSRPPLDVDHAAE
jgi:hypothetical protein